MVISFNQLRKIEQNTILLPELNLTVQKKDIVAVQCENEYIGHLFDLLNHPNQIKKRKQLPYQKADFKMCICFSRQTAYING